jgi:DNA-binding NtrC family response regulator
MLDLKTSSTLLPEPPRPATTVLLVDSDPLYCWFVREALSGTGVQVVTFPRMTDAAAYLGGHCPAALLLVDCQTLIDQGVSGLAALGRGAALAPCVLLSAAEPAGADVDAPGTTAVEKPVDLDTLVALVESRLEREP